MPSSDDLRARFSAVYTAALTDVLDELGHRHQTLPAEIVPLEPGARVAGPAFAVDLKAAWMLAKALLPQLIERRGAIVNISSIQARLTLHGFFPYAAAKAGLEGLTRSLALDYAPAGVRANAVAPGYTDTYLVQEWLSLQDDPAATLESVLANIPLGRMATPREIGNVVAFLLSDRASAITGATIAVDCGTGVRFAT